jgi:hypothetical protein
MRWSRLVVPALVLCVLPAPTHARLEPLLRHEIPKLVARKARLFVARPCEVHPVDRTSGTKRRLLPGDVLRATAVFERHRRPVPHTLVVTVGNEKPAYRARVECLSKRPPDYSYRGKASFRAYYHGLVRDLPRLMDRYLAIQRAHGHHIPVTDPETKQLSDDWQRARSILDHLRWVRGQLFHLGYSGRSERSVLKKEADWITTRGEAFIRGFSGDAPDEVKKELKKIYLLLNRLTTIPTACGRLRRLEQQATDLKDDSRYQGLEPAHRARLQSQDLAKLMTQQADWRTRLNTVVVEVRTGLMALGIKVR